MFVTASGNGNFFSPIGNLQESLTASAAHGTVAVVKTFGPSIRDGDCDSECDDGDGEGECAVILSRSPIVPQELSRVAYHSVEESEVELEGEEGDDIVQSTHSSMQVETTKLIPISSRGSVKVATKGVEERFIKSRPNLQLLHDDGLILAMTGFASDIQHLVRYVADYVSDHEHLYGGERPDACSIARDSLSDKMRKVGLVGGARPFGVQALLVESAKHKSARKRQDSSNSIMFYTVDPSGNWIHWGGGATCIGKDAEKVRMQLHRSLHDNKNKRPNNWGEALGLAMDAMVKTFHGDIETLGKLSEKEIMNEFNAIVIFGHCDKTSQDPVCAVIDGSSIYKSYLRSVKAEQS
jgi:20S proteasome alpha/beta subunit